MLIIFSGIIMETRSKWYLLGSASEICGLKLPSRKPVLAKFLHHHLVLKKDITASSFAVLENTASFWAKACIPTQDAGRARKKIKELYDEWRRLKKNAGRKTEAQKGNEAAFLRSLEDLFDIAHGDALSLMKNEEDRDFLKAQREPGRRGSMASADMKQEGVRKWRVSRQQRREQQQIWEQSSISDTVQLESSTSRSSSADNTSEDESSIPGPSSAGACAADVSVELTSSPSPPKRERKAIIDAQLAGWLDRHKVSDRAAVGVLAGAANSLGQPLEELALNRSTVRRQRKAHRQAQASSYRGSFTPEGPLVVHWDGKMMPDLTGHESVDRLPVLVSGPCETSPTLLKVPRIASGTGLNQATIVSSCLQDWNIVDKVETMCFDTTGSNTGRRAGSCVLLEQQLGKNLILVGLQTPHHGAFAGSCLRRSHASLWWS